MKNFATDFLKIEKTLSNDKGGLNLFALFLRADAPGKWDLLISAPWAEKNKAATLRSVSERLRKALSKRQLLKLSRIVIIDQSNPALAAFQRAIHVEHGNVEIKDCNFFGLQIKHAHVITSKRSEAV